MAKKNLIRAASFIILSTLVLFMTGCGSSSDNNNNSVPLSIIFSIPSEKGKAVMGKAAPQFIASISIYISAADIPVPISDTFNVVPGTRVTKNYFVPPGLARLFSVSAYGDKAGTGFLIYEGSARADLSEGENPPLTIILSEAPYTGKFVDVNRGSDLTGEGSPVNPFKTITFALTTSTGNESINVAAGFYNSTTETFPLQLKTGTELICYGTAYSTVIDLQLGAGTGISGAPNASVNGCKITNSGAAAIEDAGVQTTINNNIITNNCDGIITTGDSIITNNTIERSYLGECTGAAISSFSFTAPNSPIISGNKITDNYIGIYLFGSLPKINSNIISCNTYSDLQNNSASTIDATNNRWDNVPPKVTPSTCSGSGQDICGAGGSLVNYSGAALAPSPCP
ncbi:MAG: DUF1565 domain-containing protein [Deltaproteobacteria bacterium]|nr:DUF1565 domain-containing protein [Deltaproteobacteria bacterium]